MSRVDQVQHRPFHVMAKPSGSICNLDCEYCFYLEKENLYSSSPDLKMSGAVLESFIRQQIQAQPGTHATLAWQGGEPTLMGLDFFREVVELEKKYSMGKMVSNTFQTNGVLLDDEWCSFFKRENFLIGLSIDGPEAHHNRYRLDKGGNGTFQKVMRGLEHLKGHGVEFNTLSVVHRDNSRYPLEVYNFLKEIGSQYMQFIPIVERAAETEPDDGLRLISPDSLVNGQLTEWSVESRQYGVFLSKIFDEWVRQDVGQYYVQIFDIALEAWYGMEPSLCIFRETCGGAMVIEHNGDIYSCDHYVYPENKLGNIMEEDLAALAVSPQQQKFGQDKLDTLPDYCLNCEVRFVCHGACPKHRFIKTPGGQDGLNYLCAGYKYFFKHIDPYMKFMANELRHERPPANVMNWAREKDAGFPTFVVGGDGS